MLYSDGGSKRAPAASARRHSIRSAAPIESCGSLLGHKSPVLATVVARIAMVNGLQRLVIWPMPAAINTCI